MENCANCGTCSFHRIRVLSVNAVDCTLTSTITLSVNNIHGQSKSYLGPASTLSFTATDNTSGSCGTMEFSLAYTPTNGTTSNLIRLSSSTSNIVNFGVYNNIGDANTYSLTIRARFVGQTTWLSSASAIYTYTNPCLTATISGTAFPSITTSVLVPASSSTALWYDSVSGSASSQICGPFTVTLSFPRAPATFVSATMSSDFTYTTSTTQATFTVSPTK